MSDGRSWAEPERSASAVAPSAEGFHPRPFLMVGVHHVHQSVTVSNLLSFTVTSEGKAVLSIGPFVVAEAKPEPLPEASAAPATDSMQSDGSAAVDWIVSGSAMSRSKFTGTPGDVVVVSPDPAATLALWLPGQLEDDSKEQLEGSRTNDLLEVANSVQKRESGTPQANEIGDSPVTIWQAKFGLFGKNPAAEAGPPLPPEMGGPNMEVLGQRQARPVIRSKLAFSRGRDGSQTLSYEEEVARKDEDDASSDCGMKNHRRRGLQSAFLDLIGYISTFIVEADSSEGLTCLISSSSGDSTKQSNCS